MLHLCYNTSMTTIIRHERVRQLMDARDLGVNDLLGLLRKTEGNEGLSRITLSRILNGNYPAPPGSMFVRGLSAVLDASTDYLFGFADERHSGRAPADLVDAELVGWLQQQNAELARIMCAVQDLPAGERDDLLGHMAYEIRLVRQALASRQDAHG